MVVSTQTKTKEPYTDEFISENVFIRTITQDSIDSTEFTWHRDRSNRSVEVIKSQGWQMQFDNSLPRLLNEGDLVFIKKEEFHRIIKGNGDLVVRITENESV